MVTNQYQIFLIGKFVALRKDQLMARHWLIEAKNIDSENELYIQAGSPLPEGKARDEDKPFT